jgi:hypothetical protein
MNDYAMTSIANVRTVLFPPLEFTISLALDRSYTVREKHGRGGGQFADLSTDILFIPDECQAHGCRTVILRDAECSSASSLPSARSNADESGSMSRK